jgi:chromosome segregation ATPase
MSKLGGSPSPSAVRCLVSGKKTKEEKIQFFKIDRGGDIKPAFPKEGEEEGTNNTRSVVEPLIGPLLDPSATLEEPIGADQSNTKLEEQIHLLKPQVDDISRIPDLGSLTQDQVEILRRYISLKETEVRDMRDQKRQYQAFVKKLSSQVEELTNRSRELVAEVDVLRRRNESVQAENHELKDKFSGDMKVLQSEMEEKLRKSGNYESQVDSLSREQQEWKAKVREELKRIKLKERELENKYELLKRDAQALLDSKDKHVLEVKKKNDALELEMESLEERLRRGNTILNAIDSKKKRLVETMRLAISLLESIDQLDASAQDADDERKVG